jgi:hypothetical protein
MGGPGSGRKKGWSKGAADKDLKRLQKLRIRATPSKYPHISGFHIKAKQTGNKR